MSKTPLYIDDPTVMGGFYVKLGEGLQKTIDEALAIRDIFIQEHNVRFFLANRVLFEGLKQLRQFHREVRAVSPHRAANMSEEQAEEAFVLERCKMLFRWLDGVEDPPPGYVDPILGPPPVPEKA